MGLLDESFYKKHGDILYEHLEESICELGKNIPEYQKLISKEERNFIKYPKLETIIYEKEATALSENEVQMLIQELEIRDNIEAIRNKITFFLGYKEAYYFFQEMGLLKKD